MSHSEDEARRMLRSILNLENCSNPQIVFNMYGASFQEPRAELPRVIDAKYEIQDEDETPGSPKTEWPDVGMAALNIAVSAVKWYILGYVLGFGLPILACVLYYYNTTH